MNETQPPRGGGQKKESSIGNFSVRYPVTVTMFFLGIILLGSISVTNLPTNLFPDLRIPRITITADTPGLSPEEVEREVCERYESFLTTVKGVEHVTSVSRADGGVVQVDFDWGTDMDFALLEVKKSIGYFNIDVLSEPASVLRYDPNQLPIVTLALTGDRAMDYLYLLAYRSIGPDLERIAGVARAEISGGLIPEVRCRLAPELLTFYEITTEQVIQALTQANVSASGGWVEEGNQRYLIRAVGELQDIDQIKDVVVTYKGSVPIYLQDLGDIRWDFKESENFVRFDGKPSVGLALYKESGTNTVEVVRRVREFLAQDRANLPKDTKLEMAYDQSVFIRQAITEVQSNAISGGLLAIGILFVFLRHIRSTFIVGLSIPVSIIATFNLMYFVDLSLNIMTLGGLALGSGMLVDNAIVVLENIFRHRQIGKNAREAASDGANEVTAAITASTLTTVVVFVPIVFLGGVTAQLFKEQALTVVFSLMTSLVVALVMIPAMASRFLRGIPHSAGARYRLFTGFLRWALHHRFLVILLTIVLTVGSIPVAQNIKREFIPQAAEKQFIIKLRMPPGTELEVTDHAVASVEGWVRENGPDVEHVFARVGKGPERIAGAEQEPEGPHTAELLVSLKENSALNVPKIIAALDRKTKQIYGLTANYLLSQSSLSNMIGSEQAAIVIEVKGRKLGILSDLSRQIYDRIYRLPELTNVRTNILEGNPEVNLIPDRALMASLNLSPQRIISLISNHLRGEVATTIQDVDQTKDIRVQLGEDDQTLTELKDLLVPVADGKAVRLAELVKFEIEPGPREIVHKDQERIAQIFADFAEGVKLSDAVSAVRDRLATVNLPENYYIRLGGEEQRRAESFQGLLFALVLALILVYMVMASLFESLIHPFIIMFSMPLAAIGVIWGFYWSGQTLNMMGYIGIIMLAGIAVNNAIVLIDYVNRLRREEGVETLEALVQGAQRRIRPILMTTLTTILALVPLALGFGEGAEIRAPMAVAVIGGLVSSTVLTLVFIPVLYYLVDSFVQFLARKLKREEENEKEPIQKRVSGGAA
ncbi:MAG TPA: efflux RND transporter permease subunit [bacterium]|nr:efflux RND transporter permease subunit [bacterium]HQL60669.1 efflux RND transporter permease subunit [bacterium]